MSKIHRETFWPIVFLLFYSDVQLRKAMMDKKKEDLLQRKKDKNHNVTLETNNEVVNN